MTDENLKRENQKKENERFLGYVELLKIERTLNDVQASRLLGLANKQHLNKIRSGERPVDTSHYIRVWDLLGYDLTREVVLSFFPKQFMKRIVEVDNERIKKKLDDKED